MGIGPVTFAPSIEQEKIVQQCFAYDEDGAGEGAGGVARAIA